VGDALELKPVGGVFVRNRRKQVVFWLKGKDRIPNNARPRRKRRFECP